MPKITSFIKNISHKIKYRIVYKIYVLMEKNGVFGSYIEVNNILVDEYYNMKAKMVHLEKQQEIMHNFLVEINKYLFDKTNRENKNGNGENGHERGKKRSKQKDTPSS